MHITNLTFTNLDAIILLIAGIFGTLAIKHSLKSQVIVIGWLILAVWALLKFMRILA